MGNIRLFVSHSSEDKDIAVALVDVIEAAMVRGGERILCTSHKNKEQYGYTGQEDVSQHLQKHLNQSSCVVSVLTPNSVKSPWCLYELGGAWALAKRTYLLLAGVSQGSLPAALKETAGTQLTEPEEIRRVLAGLSKDLGWHERDKGSAAQEIDHLVDIVRRCRWPST